MVIRALTPFYMLGQDSVRRTSVRSSFVPSQLTQPFRFHPPLARIILPLCPQ